jgi:hypothetical protein
MERDEADCCLVMLGWTENVVILARVILKVNAVTYIHGAS